MKEASKIAGKRMTKKHAVKIFRNLYSERPLFYQSETYKHVQLNILNKYYI